MKKNSTQEIPVRKSTRKAPKKKSTQILPDSKSTRKAPKKKSTQILPDSKSTQKTPKKKSTQKLPDSKSTQKAPKKKSTRKTPKKNLLPEHPKQDLLPEHPKQDLLPEHPKQDLLPEHPKQDLLPEHPKQDLLPEHPKQDLLPEHPKQKFSQELPKCKSPQEKPKQRFWQKKPVLISIGIFIVISTMIITSYALFAGSHTLFTNKTDALDFCAKCHPEKVTLMNLASNAHTGAGCICHGYNPNATELFNINVAHNLTRNIYCTNCHTNYNGTTGNIMIHSGTLAAPNQSAHYLINNSNKNLIYQNAKGFFNNSKR